MTDVIAVINSGSSSIKYSLYTFNHTPILVDHGEVEHMTSTNFESSLDDILEHIERMSADVCIKAFGHRVVHGGSFLNAVQVTDAVMAKLRDLIPFAPSHQEASLHAMQVIGQRYPAVPQVACFDTAFHQTQPRLATLFAIARRLTDAGLKRYGFHGLSYEYIASVLDEHLGDIGQARVVVAHLGSGASMCALHRGQSVATSMGLTALDGLMMGTRCGAVDPGLLLYLLQEKNYSPAQLSALLYHESGLLGVSGISSDMRELESSSSPQAREAVELFCYLAAKEIASLCGVLQGCDAIVFTAGIGEKSHVVRRKIAERLGWLGVCLDKTANEAHAVLISTSASRIKVGVIPTQEAYMIAQHTWTLLA